MASNRLDGDLYVVGDINSRTRTYPAGSISDAAIAAGAAIAATKQVQQHVLAYAQDSGATAADEERVIHVVYGAAGTSIAFEAGCVVTNDGECTITIDLLKNGTTVLTVAPVITSSHSAYELVTGTIGTTALVDGDVLEITIATAGTNTVGLGPFCSLVLREDPA